MATYNTLDPEIKQSVSNYAVSGRDISWAYLERVCGSFDDILEVVNYALNLGASFSGNPSPRLEQYLKNHGIDLRKLR